MISPFAPFVAAYATVTHLLPWAVIPVLMAAFSWKAVQK